MSLLLPSPRVEVLAHQLIGAAIEVHRELGPGFREQAYQEALGLELAAREIPFLPQVPVPLRYKGQPLSTTFRLGLVVGGLIIVELKTVEALTENHIAQTLAYLGASGLPLGLLLNFQVPILKYGIRRVLPLRTPP